MSPDTNLLYEKLTVHENFRFVRRLGESCGGTKSLVQQRVQVLSETLQLPNEHCQVGNLPTSEKDRVTLAAVLIHAPYLLLIQKPTKAQDRSMKERILDLLRTVSREEGVAILLFTDDPEEAAKADDVSIVINGCLMARDSPNRLLEEFQCKTLEEVFETLHTKGECAVVGDPDSLEEVCVITKTSALETEKKTVPMHEALSAVKHTVNSKKAPPSYISKTPQRDVRSVSWHRIFLRLEMELTTFKIPNLALPLILWGLCLSISAVSIPDPSLKIFQPELPVALVKSNSTSLVVDYFLDSLKIEYLPFVSSSNDTSLQRPYDCLDEALASLERGETCAVMRVGENFSSAPHYQFVLRSRADENHAPIESVLDIDVDAKSQEIRFILQRAIVLAAQKLPLKIKEATNGSSVEMESRLEEPVFGSRLIGLIEFIAPGIFIYTTFGSAVLVARTETPRTFASVLQTTITISREIAISTFFYFICVLFMHLGLTLFCMCLLNCTGLLPLKGSIVLAIVLIFMQGLLGIAVGLSMTFLGMLVFGKRFDIFWNSIGAPEMFVICAAFGPRVGFARIVRCINHYVLVTTSTESLRNILYRGCGLGNDDVLGAFTGLATRIVVFFLFAALLLKFLRFAGRSHVQACLQSCWEGANLYLQWGNLVEFGENRFRIWKQSPVPRRVSGAGGEPQKMAPRRNYTLVRPRRFTPWRRNRAARRRGTRRLSSTGIE